MYQSNQTVKSQSKGSGAVPHTNDRGCFLDIEEGNNSQPGTIVNVKNVKQSSQTDDGNEVAVDKENSSGEYYELDQKRGKEKLPEDEIIRIFNERYEQEENLREVSVIYKDDKIYDEPKKAVYGI